MDYEAEVRDDLLSRAAKAQHRVEGGMNDLTKGWRHGWRQVRALAAAADPADPDALAGAVAERADACAPAAAKSAETREHGRASAWQDAARAVALYRADAFR